MKTLRISLLFLYSFLIFISGCNAQEPSKIVIENLTDAQIANLFKVGKVWGFLKYYHPEILKGNYNWDNELIKILPEVLNQNANVNRILLDRINDLDSIIKRDTTSEVKEVKLSADLNWTSNTDFLGSELSKILNAVKNSTRPPNNYYVDFVIGIGNPNFKNENTYSNLS